MKLVTILALSTSLSVAAAQAAPTDTTDSNGQTMQQLYQAALKEGNTVTVYAGGDEVTQGSGLKSAFEKQFPGLKLNIIVDLSKYHDANINEQLARHKMQVDVATLQTLHDFDYWKSVGALENYKPIGWNQIKPSYRDADGAFTGVFMISFSTVYNKNLVAQKDIAHSYLDFLKPVYKNRLILPYPNDDDAVLYMWDKIISKYGLSFVDRLMKQNPTFVRGTQTPPDAVAAGKYAAAFGISGPFFPDENSALRLALPASDPFLTWAQTGAIFKNAPHPAAARLYMSWLLTPTVQRFFGPWSVRQDLPAVAPYKAMSSYNTSPEDFLAFMRDRARVERMRSLVERFVGPVQGISPLKD